MAFDLKAVDKKKVAVIGGAIVAGIIAVVLTNSYINESVEQQAGKIGSAMSSKEVQQLTQRINELEGANQQIVAQMRKLATAQPQQAAAPRQTTAPTQPMLAMQTPVGKRAMAVTIDQLSAVGGMVAPGDYVDVIGHLNVPADDGKTNRVTVTLFQHIRVLAVADNTEIGKKSDVKSGAIPIAFALNPQEASLLSFAKEHGTLQLILRSPADSNAYAVPQATWETLSDYLKTSQGVDINAPTIESTTKKVINPIEIYKAGQQQ